MHLTIETLNDMLSERDYQKLKELREGVVCDPVDEEMRQVERHALQVMRDKKVKV